jgi:hypothetical protein
MATANFAYAASADDAAAQPVLAIFADRPHIRHQLREDALAAGFRVNESGPVASLHAGDARPLAEVVLVDCPAPDGAALAALARLDVRAHQAGAHLIVATSVAGLEDVFGCLDQSQPQLLVDPGAADIALALALSPGRSLREMGDQDRMQLLRLTEQVGRIAARLGGFEGGGRVAAPGLAFDGAVTDEAAQRLRSPRPALPEPRLIRRILSARQQRARFFDAELFADPAWDMLLDLTASRAEHKRVSVTSLCIAAGVPPTTALRWIGQMQHAGLFERVEDTMDRRRAFIGLTDSAAEAMARYFPAIGELNGGEVLALPV